MASLSRDHDRSIERAYRLRLEDRPRPFLGLMLALCASLACSSKKSSDPLIDEPTESTTADRLTADESLPEAETVFGLPIPPGMRVTRHFSGAAYVAGDMDMQAVLEHVRSHINAREVEMTSQRALFAQAHIKGDAQGRLFRIEVSSTRNGSQLHVKDITPPPATSGLSESERWQRAGRKPDGTPLDPNQMY